MAALRVGEAVDAVRRDFDLLVRQVSTEAVATWLPKLTGTARLEGAAYADEAGRDSWWVVQALGTTLCDAEGIVLVFNRDENSWHSIYDVQSGCSYQLNYPLLNLVVEGDRMYASICTECDGWPMYEDCAIDLRTFCAAHVGIESAEAGPDADEDRTIHEIPEGIFPTADP